MKLDFADITFDKFKIIFLEQLKNDLESDQFFNFNENTLIEIPTQDNKMSLIYTIKKFNDFVFISAGWNNQTYYIIKTNNTDEQISKFLEDTFGFSENTNSYIKKYMDNCIQENDYLDNLHIYNII